MTDYAEAAMNEATVRCSDGSEWFINYIPAGREGWVVPVIIIITVPICIGTCMVEHCAPVILILWR
jgi:hypothetical protein